MTRNEAAAVARAAAQALPISDQGRLKGVDVVRRLHMGMLTLRLYFVNRVAEDPEPFIFKGEELGLTEKTDTPDATPGAVRPLLSGEPGSNLYNMWIEEIGRQFTYIGANPKVIHGKAVSDIYWRCSPCQHLLTEEEGTHCWRCGYKGTRLTRSVQTGG